MSTDTLVHADIFFFVTTIAVALLSIAALIVAFYLIKALAQAQRALSEVEEHAGEISEDVKDVLYDLRESAAYRFLFKRKRKR